MDNIDVIIAESIDDLVAGFNQKPDFEPFASRAGLSASKFQDLISGRIGMPVARIIEAMNQRQVRDFYGLTEKTSDLEHNFEAVIDNQTNNGEGLTIAYGWHPTIAGEVLLAETVKGLCYLGFRVERKRQSAMEKMKAHLPDASYVEDPDKTASGAVKLNSYFTHPDKAKLKLHLCGTRLQTDVWEELLKIPFGTTMTYGDVARRLGRPTAARAIGNAVGANPVSLFVPCHRVIRSTGVIDNYGWGSHRKKLLLSMEGERRLAHTLATAA